MVLTKIGKLSYAFTRQSTPALKKQKNEYCSFVWLERSNNNITPSQAESSQEESAKSVPAISDYEKIKEYAMSRKAKGMEDVISKHGLLLEEDRNGLKFYRKRVDGVTIELMELVGVYSLFINEWEIAARYRCDTPTQLEFILLNGRAGTYFNRRNSSVTS